MVEIADLQIKFKLSRTMAKALSLLLDKQRVTGTELKEELETVLDAKMIMHRLRKKLSASGISIQSRRDVGYWLDDSTKADLLHALVGEAPAGHAGESDGTEDTEDHRSDDDHKP